MDHDRRTPSANEPADAKLTLNEAQLQTLQTVENFGWHLRFVRQPLFLLPIPVIYSPHGKAFAVIEEDGKLNTNIEIQLREQR